MKRVNAILSASGLVLALSIPGWAQEVKQLPTHTITVSGTVDTIDHDKRVLQIKTADSTFETLDVPLVSSRCFSKAWLSSCEDALLAILGKARRICFSAK